MLKRCFSSSASVARFQYVNKAVLIGNVGKAPEIKEDAQGRKYARFSLATGESYKNKDTEEYDQVTHWHRVAVFQPQLAEFVEKHVGSGTKLYVEGRLRNKAWTDKDGNERQGTQVELGPYDSGVEIVVLSKAEQTQ